MTQIIRVFVACLLKTTIGHNTTTPWELENMEKIDDPEVFEFNITNGILKGKTLPLRKVPEGLLVPPVPKNEEEKNRTDNMEREGTKTG